MKGVRRHGAGWQAEVRVTGHPRSVQQFPLETDLSVISAWRKDEAARLRLTSRRATKGTFAADAKLYLSAIATMPSFKMRRRDIQLWVEVFGTRPRHQITRADIRIQRDTWYREGPKRVWKKHPDRYGGAWVDVRTPLAASTVNHRLRALANLWTVLDGPQAPNPARDVPEIEEEQRDDRSLPYALIEMIVEAMPDRGRGLKGEKRTDVSLTKLRARAIAYTGLSHAELGRLKPTHVNLEEGWLDTGKRRKGKGVLTGRRPLTPQGLAAMRALIAAGGLTGVPFSSASMRKSIRRATRKVADALEQNSETAVLAPMVRKIRPYDLRHSYVAEVLEKSGDFEATRMLSGHADLRTTLVYGGRAVNPVLTAALAKVTSAGGFSAPEKRASDATS